MNDTTANQKDHFMDTVTFKLDLERTWFKFQDKGVIVYQWFNTNDIYSTRAILISIIGF